MLAKPSKKEISLSPLLITYLLSLKSNSSPFKLDTQDITDQDYNIY